MEQLAGSLSGAALGAYLLSVAWHGNIPQLGTYLKEEEGYLEFIVALLLLGMVNRYAPLNKYTKAITSFAVLAALVSIGGKVNFGDKLKLFMNGKVSGLETIKSLFQG